MKIANIGECPGRLAWSDTRGYGAAENGIEEYSRGKREEKNEAEERGF